MTQYAASQLANSIGAFLRLSYKTTRRCVIAILGMTVVLFGIILFFTPGPALLVIPVGLAILATEFIWAQRVLKRFKRQASRLMGKLKKKNDEPDVCDELQNGCLSLEKP